MALRVGIDDVGWTGAEDLLEALRPTRLDGEISGDNATHIQEFEEDAYEYEEKGEYPNPF